MQFFFFVHISKTFPIVDFLIEMNIIKCFLVYLKKKFNVIDLIRKSIELFFVLEFILNKRITFANEHYTSANTHTTLKNKRSMFPKKGVMNCIKSEYWADYVSLVCRNFEIKKRTIKPEMDQKIIFTLTRFTIFIRKKSMAIALPG